MESWSSWHPSSERKLRPFTCKASCGQSFGQWIQLPFHCLSNSSSVRPRICGVSTISQSMDTCPYIPRHRGQTCGIQRSTGVPRACLCFQPFAFFSSPEVYQTCNAENHHADREAHGPVRKASSCRDCQMLPSPVDPVQSSGSFDESISVSLDTYVCPVCFQDFNWYDSAASGYRNEHIWLTNSTKDGLGN